MRNPARSLAIGVALTPLALFGLVAVYTDGSVQALAAGSGVGLFAAAALAIYLVGRPQPRPAPAPVTERAPDRVVEAPIGWVAEAPTERLVELDLDVRWDRENDDWWFVHRDGGAALVLRPDAQDPDRRLVVVVWASCAAARVGVPGAEDRYAHHLFRAGLGETDWAAEVHWSNWIAEIAALDEVAATGLRHFVILTRAETVEVVGPEVVVQRLERMHLAADSTVRTQ